MTLQQINRTPYTKFVQHVFNCHHYINNLQFYNNYHHRYNQHYHHHYHNYHYHHHQQQQQQQQQQPGAKHCYNLKDHTIFIIITFYVHETQVHRVMLQPDYPVKDECCSRAVVVCFYSIECEEALGMGDGEISNGQVIASSQLDAEHAAINGRLKAIRTSNKVGSWSPYTNDVKQWLQIDLGSQERTLVAKIASQGENTDSTWVTHYTLLYSDNGNKFNAYKELGQGKDKVRRLFFAKVKKKEFSISPAIFKYVYILLMCTFGQSKNISSNPLPLRNAARNEFIN